MSDRKPRQVLTAYAIIMAIYLLILNGGFVVGSVIGGTVANIFGILVTISKSGLLILGLIISVSMKMLPIMLNLWKTSLITHYIGKSILK